MTDNVFSQWQISFILNWWLRVGTTIIAMETRLQRSDLLQQGALATHSGL